MTNPTDKDLWLGGEPAEEQTPKPKRKIKTTAESEPVEEQVTEGDPTPEPEAAEDVAPIAEDSPESPESPESVDNSKPEFEPTEIPVREGGRYEELYSSRGGAFDTAPVQKSEATFIPSEPKIYVAPGSENADDEPEFGFPEVPVNTQRLFIAIELPRTIKREFTELANSFRPREYERVRWIEHEAMHLTLKFLGDTPVERIDDIKTALQRAASSTGKFTIKIDRTGCFPSFLDPRICWVGLSGEMRRLEQLQGRVEGGMTALGFDEEDREFRAHVTIGRTRPGIRGRFAEDIGISWQHAPLRSTGKVLPVSAIALYRSYLGEDESARYEQLANFELG